MFNRDLYFSSAQRMEQDGGGFASRIAEAFFYADTANAQKLVEAFSELFENYMSQDERDELRASKALMQADRLLKLLEV
jgi:hypothetical protein